MTIVVDWDFTNKGITGKWSFSFNNFFIKFHNFHGKNFGSHNTTMFYQNLCQNEMYYKGTVLNYKSEKNLINLSAKVVIAFHRLFNCLKAAFYP